MSSEYYQFVKTDAYDITEELISVYESMTGMTVLPASPENLFIRWVASVIVQERALMNYIGNQNIPSRAEGSNLDALGVDIYNVMRPAAQPSVTTMRFTISAAQNSAILIPSGTRVTTMDRVVFWATQEDVYIPAGNTYADISVICQTKGTVGNGYEPGQINTIVDVFNYYASCTNLTISDGGAEAADDEEYFELMRASMDGYSCAGARGGYAYFARQVSTEISDVLANTPTPGHVAIYAVMNTREIASAEIKAAILAACSAEEVRPLTDYVTVEDPETVSYSINLTYYITSGTKRSAVDIEADVAVAIDSYIAWQCARFGRDINPDKLREFLLNVDGVKRIDLISPTFTILRNGLDDTVPQVAMLSTKTVVNGGYEDE